VAAGPKEEFFVSFLQEGNETSKQRKPVRISFSAAEGCQKKITDKGKGRIANEGPIFLVFTLLPVPVLPVLSTSSAQANGFFLGSILRSLSALGGVVILWTT
jgi:hypothetical protein